MTMYLENGTDLVRGVLLLISAALSYRVDFATGMILVAAMGG
jgi:hypothetical protein